LENTVKKLPTDMGQKDLSIRIDLLAHRFNVMRRRRLSPRTTCPRLAVVPLHRSLMSRLAGVLGFGD
jgi:hypothetical protein